MELSQGHQVVKPILRAHAWVFNGFQDAELGEAVQQPSEPPQKRPRMDEAVASPARLRR